MKKSSIIFIIAVFLACGTLFAQPNVRITVFDPLPTIDFGSFIVANNLQGAPRLFFVEINGLPHDRDMVTVEGTFSWKEVGSSNYTELYYFKSRPFKARTFYNNEIGVNDIKISTDRSSKNDIEKNMQKGKPSGTYRLTFTVTDERGATSTDSKEMTFENPSQNLLITSPIENTVVDPNNVLVSWTSVPGASSYKLKIGIKQSANQTPEEALNSGTPLLDNYDLGSLTSINLREYKRFFQREWTGGQEIVLAVTAVIPGPAGGSTVKSNIISFYLLNNNPTAFTALTPSLTLLLQQFASQLQGSFLQGLLNGNTQILGFYREDGSPMSMSEIIMLLNSLSANPGRIFSITHLQ